MVTYKFVTVTVSGSAVRIAANDIGAYVASGSGSTIYLVGMQVTAAESPAAIDILMTAALVTSFITVTTAVGSVAVRLNVALLEGYVAVGGNTRLYLAEGANLDVTDSVATLDTEIALI